MPATELTFCARNACDHQDDYSDDEDGADDCASNDACFRGEDVRGVVNRCNGCWTQRGIGGNNASVNGGVYNNSAAAE